MTTSTSQKARVFRAETQFESQAKKKGGVSRDEALKRADEGLETIKPEVIFWLKQGVASLDIAIQKTWIDQNDPSRFDNAIELSASLRDIGSTINYTLLSFICKNIYEILEAQKQGATFRKDIIDCHRMALILSAQEEYRDRNPDDVPMLKSGLLNILTIVRKETGQPNN